MKERVLLITVVSILFTVLMVCVSPRQISVAETIITFYSTLMLSSLILFGLLTSKEIETLSCKQKIV